MFADEFLDRPMSQLNEVMAWFQIEHEDWEYRKRDLDPVLAQEKLDAMEDELGEFELADELERLDHAEFFKDIAKPEKPKLTVEPRQPFKKK